MTDPAPEFTGILKNEAPGKALDLACGSGRHSLWLAHRSWQVTAVDVSPALIPGVDFHQANLEAGYPIQTAAWDLIICWLYYQPDLLPKMRAGLRPGGIIATAGKTSGRFATSLDCYREAFAGLTELASGGNGNGVFFIARYNE